MHNLCLSMHAIDNICIIKCLSSWQRPRWNLNQMVHRFFEKGEKGATKCINFAWSLSSYAGHRHNLAYLAAD